MTDYMVIPGAERMKENARAMARRVFTDNRAFESLSLAEQQDLYLSVVQEYIDKEKASYGIGLASEFATDSGADMGFKGYDPGLGGDTRAFTELVQSVDFPKFVADLLKAVFDANLNVMKTQTDSYIKLMKEASKSTGEFIKKVKDEESFMKLAETKGDQYNVTMEDTPQGKKMALTNPAGEKVDHDDAEVKRHILEAKINMAKEHRAALREVLLMGVTRLVVNKGLIEAGVEFTVKAHRAATSKHEGTNINTVNVEAEYESPFAGVFGGAGGSMSMTNTNIQVNTAEKKATDDMSATLKGRVQIEFKTDYFKLDNFATMYGDGGVGAVKPAGPGAPGQIAPPPTR